MANYPIVIKRSPVVLIRTFAVIEAAGFIAYLLAAALGNSKYELYTRLSLSSLLSYQIAKYLFLSVTQLAITVYAFLRWYYETYLIEPGAVAHEWGVFLKKRKSVPLRETYSLTLSSWIGGKVLNYGSIAVRNSSPGSLLTLADVPSPEAHLRELERAIGSAHHTPQERPDLASLLSSDEHEGLEFKSSLRFDHRNRQVNRELERAAMKTVAAFLNSQGGRLVIGVDDARKPLGLEHDYRTLGRQSSDGFENHFTQVFNAMIGAEFRHLVRLWFDRRGGCELCVVDVSPSTRPVYLKYDHDEQFYVRTGNVTTPLKLSEVESYARARWTERHFS